MTVQQATIDKRVAKIKSKGYWRVVIRPAALLSNRIENLSVARDLIESSVVSFRGWDYPFWDRSQVTNVGKYIEWGVDWGEHIEYARFYLSGQFVHLRALWEYQDVPPRRYPPRPQRAGYVSVVSAIFTVTEVYEFAARLSKKVAPGEPIHLTLELHNVADHQLETFDFSRPLFREYVRKFPDPISIDRTYPATDLVARTDQLAQETVAHIFECFDWDHPPKDMIAQDQKRLRERRFG